MTNIKATFKLKSYIVFAFFLTLLMACSASNDMEEDAAFFEEEEEQEGQEEEIPQGAIFADIDFSNWKVTLPVDMNNNGGPDEYQPSQLINNGYRTLTEVQPFMYDDTTDASIIFYTYPDVSTTNSSYSRTELRELINPSNSRENWSLLQGGVMSGKLKVQSISQNNGSGSNTYHNVIVMQIHGIISIEDMNSHGFSSNNGPPLLKMYWKDGYLWSHKKSLVNENTEGDALLDVSSSTWADVKHNMGYVGFEAFDFKITASSGKLELQLNDNEPLIYQDVSLNKWPFENYFKAGNYLVSTDANAFAYIKYYHLNILH